VFDAALTLLIGSRPLQLIHAPGHWPDQLVVLEPEAGILWAGDMLSDVEIPFVSQSLIEYERTLRMLRGLEIKVLVPGHGSPTTDEDEINRRLMDDGSYLAELRRAVAGWIGRGQLPGTSDELAQGFQPSNKLDANRYPHKLNCETVWRELGGAGLDDRPGWESQ
jgi:glyoxylase-like metal-dependent hydrolase (beta-lactamase superfamily II)